MSYTYFYDATYTNFMSSSIRVFERSIRVYWSLEAFQLLLAGTHVLMSEA